jgi:hypothetical protein
VVTTADDLGDEGLALGLAVFAGVRVVVDAGAWQVFHADGLGNKTYVGGADVFAAADAELAAPAGAESV